MNAKRAAMLDGRLVGRLHLEGDVEFHLAQGLEARLRSLDVEADEDKRFLLTFGGALGEIRKIGRFVPPVRALLKQADDADDEAPARVTLAATAEQRARLAAAAEGAPLAWETLREREAWMDALLDLERYAPAGIELEPRAQDAPPTLPEAGGFIPRGAAPPR